jgi:hypothetical protein
MRVSIYLIQLFLFGLTIAQHDDHHPPRKSKIITSACVDCNSTLDESWVECKGNNDYRDLNNCLIKFQNTSSFIFHGYRGFSENIFQIKMENVVTLDISNNSIDVLNYIQFQNLPNLNNLTLKLDQLANFDFKFLLNSSYFSKNLKILKLTSEFDNLKIIKLNEDLIHALVSFKNTFHEFEVDLSSISIGCGDCSIEILTRKLVLWRQNELKCIDLEGNQQDMFNYISNKNCSNIDYSTSTNVKILSSNNSAKSKKFSGKNLLIFLFAMIVLSSLFIYLLNKNRKSLVRAQQRRYVMLRDQQENLSLNKPANNISENSNKKSSFFHKLFKSSQQPYEEFNDEYVESSSQIYKLNRLSDSTENEDVIIMDRSNSLNGSSSQIEKLNF